MNLAVTLPHLLSAGRFAGTRDCTWHAHEGHELVLVTAGACTIACGETELAARPGTLLVLPRGLPQYQRTQGETRTCYAIWQAGDAILAPHPRALTLPLDATPARWLEDLCDLMERSEPEPGVVDALLLALLTALGRIEEAHRREAGLHPALAEATRLLTADLAAPLELDRLAAQVGVGSGYLARLFRRHHGCPPLRYQQRLRLRLAERLLQDPTLQISEISQRCGWPNVNYFIRLFRRHAGRSPGAWRGTRRSA